MSKARSVSSAESNGLNRYRAAPKATMKAERLDDLTANYHRASGQTHLLVEPAPEILEALAAAPLTRDELLARLAAEYDLADGIEGAIDARLAELVAAGLVEAA